MTQSDEELMIYEVEWVFVINPLIFAGGSSNSVKIPKWFKSSKNLMAWSSYSDGEGDIACAAIAICLAINGVEWLRKDYTRNNNSMLKVNARNLQREMGWGSYVTMAELEQFVKKYPKYRLTCLTSAQKHFADYTYTGTDFVEEQDREVFTSRKPSGYYLYLYLDFDLKHYVNVPAPAQFYRMKNNAATQKFCHKCVQTFTQFTTHTCNDIVTWNQIKKIVPCQKCGIYGCTNCPKEQCFSCKGVHQKLPVTSPDFHRCIFMGLEKEDKGYNMGENDGKKPSLWVYDLESCIEKKFMTYLTPVHELDSNGFYVHSTTVTNEVNRQVPNLVYAKNVFTGQVLSYFGETCISEFITFILNHNGGNSILLAHNAAGYDTRLIFDDMTKRAGGIKLNPILNGCKFMELKIAQKIFFRDSRMHLGGSIKSLANDYGCVLGKEIFPHLFNSAENYDYRGGLPNRKYYDVTGFKTTTKGDEYNDFQEWYNTESQLYNDENPWVFKDKLFEYCKNDVEVLADIVLKYHEIYYERFQISPWKHMTSSSYFHTVSKMQMTKMLELPERKDPQYCEIISNHAKTDHFARLQGCEYAIARAALRGGRTGVGRVLTELSKEQKDRGCKIKYFDVVSLYPYHQVAHDFPTSIPTIHVYDYKFAPCIVHKNSLHVSCDCPLTARWKDTQKVVRIVYETEQPTVDDILNDPSFNGFVIATVDPPKNMLHPVLVHYDEKENKCNATCERLVEQTFTSCEFKVALQNGYKLERVHRFDKYKMAPPPWEDFVKQMYIFKLINSRTAPEGQELAEMIEEYDMLFDMGDDISRIPKELWGKNPAKKAAAKTGLNSGWGKHAQRPRMDKAEIINYTNPDDRQKAHKLFTNFAADKFTLLSGQSLGNQDYYMYKYLEDGATVEVDLSNSYLPAACFVPAYGRLQLWEQLNKLGDRVIMYDTDSVVFIYDPDLYNPTASKMWGCWEEEDISAVGITGVVCTGPKSYAMKCVDPKYNVVKLKGISQTRATDNILNYDTIKNMVLKSIETKQKQTYFVPQVVFDYRLGRGIHTRPNLKKLTFDCNEQKGDIRENFIMYPKGHQ